MNLGIPEIIIIFVLLVVLYGKQLPQITRVLGRSLSIIRKNISDIKAEVQRELIDDGRQDSSGSRSEAENKTAPDLPTRLEPTLDKMLNNNQHDLAG
jgi:Sec-independent protein translocase protein TatA